MKKIDWKMVAFDAIKAALAVVIGALMGSCTVHHLCITSVNVPDSAFVQKIDNSIHSWSEWKDSVLHNTFNYNYEK